MEYFDKKLEENYQPDVEVFSFNLIRPLIEKKAENFFKFRDVGEFELLSEKIIISSLFFKKIDFQSYFYGEVFRGIYNKDFCVKYGVTINNSLVDQYCEKANMKYSTINLNKLPVVYYFYFPIEEIAVFMESEAKKRLLLD